MKIYQFLQDGTGNLSATRLAFLLWVIGALVVWVYQSFMSTDHGKMIAFDPTITTVIGILMTGKVAQSFSPSDGK
ncbi:hypothetical protein HX870_16230 [Pseudomonas gingeri]|uniref:hypothetical protein n=1 Tax=Pseudomonas gingeri TaxID=117681 RepID=UPI0015A10F25|nr:hypothetical protein [Pseudomonas gingeri]NWD69151.1 hypothetical protein [Pseudomonas gingeri]